MSDHNQTIAEVLNAWVGGAFTTIIGATLGRIMYHAQEVKKSRRSVFSKELIWEMPVAVGIGMIADAIGAYFGVIGPVGTGLAVGMGYLGPRGLEVLFTKWFDRNRG